MEKLSKLPKTSIAFIQSLLLSAYIFLVGLIMVNGNDWFGPMDKTPIIGPMMFLTLFISSALISAGIVLFVPFYTFWVKKDLKKAITIVLTTIGFLILYFFIYLLILFSTR